MAAGGVNCCIMVLCDLFNNVIIKVFFHAERSAFMRENVAGMKVDK